MIGNDDPLADLQWRLQNGDLSGANSADKQKILELAKANQELVVIDKERVALANQLKQAQDGVDSSIADLSQQIALFGNDNPLSAFLYDMQNTDKYVGATAEKLQMMASKKLNKPVKMDLIFAKTVSPATTTDLITDRLVVNTPLIAAHAVVIMPFSKLN